MSIEKLLFKKHVKEILKLLNEKEEVYFSEMAEILELPQGSAGRILKDLTDGKLVSKSRPESEDTIPKVYYRLTELGKKALLVYDITDEIELEILKK